MMHAKHLLTTSMLALGLCAGAGTAQASVIGATPNADFTDGSYTFSLANDSASYTFSDTGTRSSADQYPAVAVQTGGAARFNTLFGSPAAYDTISGGPVVNQSLLGSFESYPDTTPIPFSNEDSYYALGLALDDGLHYGYARIADHTLLSYAYQSDPGTGIAAGTAPSSTPPSTVVEPASFGVFGLGLALLGFGVATRYRASTKH